MRCENVGIFNRSDICFEYVIAVKWNDSLGGCVARLSAARKNTEPKRGSGERNSAREKTNADAGAKARSGLALEVAPHAER